MPGVSEVLTAADVPVNEYGLIMPDQPVLGGLGSTPQAATVRWEADHVALVVAESQAEAEAANLGVPDHHPFRATVGVTLASAGEVVSLIAVLFREFRFVLRDGLPGSRYLGRACHVDLSPVSAENVSAMCQQKGSQCLLTRRIS